LIIKRRNKPVIRKKRLLILSENICIFYLEFGF
jgi:hypothetical protein